jgi:uncharacterized cupredoxin-like copper-binding protein
MIMHHAITRRFLPLLWALLLVACGAATETPAVSSSGGAAPGSPPAAVTVTATEFHFEPSTLTLKAGEATSLTFKNAGQTLHDFTLVSGPGVPTPDAIASGMDHMKEKSPYHVAAEAGTQATQSLNLPAGTYTFICSVQGHKDLGMQGTITVR